MTKQLQVLLAVKALIVAALPLAEVRGFEADANRPDRIGSGGCVIGLAGDPGEPEMDLSPPVYNYTHRIEFEAAAANGAAGEPLDAMLRAIGIAVENDRTLGGLCDYLDVEAAVLGDTTGEMVSSINWAASAIIATYSTSSPLA